MPSLFAARNAPVLESAARLKARREAIRHRRDFLCKRGARDTGYRPAWIRRTILGMLNTEWTSKHDIGYLLQQLDPSGFNWSRVHAVLDFLVDHFRIEEARVYEWCRTPKNTRHTLEERMEEPPIGTSLGHSTAYRIMPYQTQAILAVIDRLLESGKRGEAHPRTLAAETQMRPDFIWYLWHHHHHPEELTRRRNILTRRSGDDMSNRA